MNYSINNISSECEMATSIFSFAPFCNTLIAECIIATLAILPNTMILSVVWKTIVLPCDLRLLLGHLSFIFLWFSLGDIIKTLYLLLVDPCAYTISHRQCRAFDLATTWLILPNVYYSLLPLCLERLYATVNYQVYDNVSNRKPWFALVLILCAWITAGLINGRTLFLLPNDQFVPICDGTFLPSPSDPIATFSAYLALEFVAGFLTGFIYFYNRHVARSMAINRARYDLSARFQIDQNVHINEVIIPSMILHFIYHLPSFTLTVVTKSPITLPLEIKALLSRLTILWRLVYALTHPISAFYFNKHLRNHLMETPFGKVLKAIGLDMWKGKVVEAATMQNAEKHFDYLDNLWANAKMISRPNKVAPSQKIIVIAPNGGDAPIGGATGGLKVDPGKVDGEVVQLPIPDTEKD